MDHFFARHVVDLRSPERRSQLASALARDGIATFAGVLRRLDGLAAAREVLELHPHRDAEADGVTVIRDLGGIADRPGCAGFGTGELYPHTEGTTLAQPPSALMLVCSQPADSGGESLLVDFAAVHTELSAMDADLVARLSEQRSALFGGGTGFLGSVLGPGEAGRVVVRFRGDDLVRFHPSIAERLPIVREAITRHTVRLDLRRGDGFLVSNTRWLHARTSFAGPRTMFRILGDPLPDLAIPNGFRPSRRPSAARRPLRTVYKV